MSWRSAPVWDGEYTDVRWRRRGAWEDGVCGGRTVVLVFRELWRSGRTFLAALHGASAVSDLGCLGSAPVPGGVVRFTCKSVYLTHFQNTVVQEALYVPRGGENVLSGERGGEGLAHTAQRALFLRPAELLCFLLQGQQQCGRGRRLSRAAVSCSSLCLTSAIGFLLRIAYLPFAPCAENALSTFRLLFNRMSLIVQTTIAITTSVLVASTFAIARAVRTELARNTSLDWANVVGPRVVGGRIVWDAVLRTPSFPA